MSPVRLTEGLWLYPLESLCFLAAVVLVLWLQE